MFPPDLEALLARVGFRDQATARNRVHELTGDAAELLALVRISADLGDALAQSADPDAAIRHFSRLVQARGSRLQLYHLLAEDRATMERLIRVVAGSQYLADVLVRNPEYLTIVSDSVVLATPRSGGELAEELERTCAPFPSVAAKLDAVRRF